jgi:cation diffusion facilitator CzcD-associated flavoprotein CzcO
MGFDCDVAIVGAGPYGLSTAAHLHAANGLDVRVFGEPMTFWERKMPVGMLLRSPWLASNLSDPHRASTIDRFRAAVGAAFAAPVPLERFVEYGRWFQREHVPSLDRRDVARVERLGEGFRVELADGEQLRARRVVVAAGIERFAWHPPEFAGLPSHLVSHTVDHRDLSAFAGKRVVVAGGGQSGLESAALLHEAGAEVEVLVKKPYVVWLTRRWQHKTPILSSMLYAWPDVGPAGASHLVARPALYRRMPRKWQDPLAKRSIRAAGAAWLVPRLEQVPIHTGVAVRETARSNGHLELTLTDGSRRTADHVLLATGYRVDVSKYPFLDPQLVSRIDRVNGHPRLDHGFESSVAGLHFVGAPAAWSHGPLMRFVAGSAFAAGSVTKAILPQSIASRRG